MGLHDRMNSATPRLHPCCCCECDVPGFSLTARAWTTGPQRAENCRSPQLQSERPGLLQALRQHTSSDVDRVAFASRASLSRPCLRDRVRLSTVCDGPWLTGRGKRTSMIRHLTLQALCLVDNLHMQLTTSTDPRRSTPMARVERRRAATDAGSDRRSCRTRKPGRRQASPESSALCVL